ncbi:MAG: zinc-ribbon domain-containing protein, partial [Oscillospiraceae bacterium]|nr:zinc-ribbon domain-containing protein [Oscillospiraceae bacterium]
MSEMKDKIFKFGGDVKNSAEKLAKGAIDGSKKMAEKVRIKNGISHAESRLNAAYIEVGKKYEELFGNEAAEEFATAMAEIADAKAQIAALRAELAAMDSAALCPSCGKYVQEGQRFCPYCGAKQVKDEPAPETWVPAP